MNFNRFTAVLLSAVALTACEKNGVQVITAPTSGAYVRFANFGVNAPGVNFYANDTKLSAVTSTTGTESTTGVAAGAFAIASGLYYSVAPGSYTLSGRIAAATDKDLAVSKATTSLDNGKFYTFYTSGIYDATAKSIDNFIVEDPIPSPIDPTMTYVRFVNASSISGAMTLFATNTTTNAEVPVGGLVAYKAAGAFTPLTPGIYNLNTRVSGSTANAITRAAVSFVAGRVYTITARATSTTAATLDFTANR